MIGQFCSKRHLVVLLAPALLLIGQNMKAATVTVAMSVSASGANHLYDFAITNYSSTDPLANLVSVDFNLPAGTLIGTPVAPAGNGEVVDSSAGGDFVEFSSNNLAGFPVGTTVDGFKFVSASLFTTLPFVANYLNAAQTAATPFNGTTTPQAAVPEPSTLGLLAGAGILLLSRMRRQRSL